MGKPTKQRLRYFIILQKLTDNGTKMERSIFSYWDLSEAATDYSKLKADADTITCEWLDEERMCSVFEAGFAAILEKNRAKHSAEATPA